MKRVSGGTTRQCDPGPQVYPLRGCSMTVPLRVPAADAAAAAECDAALAALVAAALTAEVRERAVAAGRR